MEDYKWITKDKIDENIPTQKILQIQEKEKVSTQLFPNRIKPRSIVNPITRTKNTTFIQ